MKFFLLLVPALALNLYCPSSNDLQVAYSGGSISIVNQGWTIGGGGGVASKAAFNLLGGWISYTFNANSDQQGVNANIYTISPHFSGSSFNKGSDYCDGQGGNGNYPWCVEVDLIESNGNCGGASTLHTVQGGGSGCNSGGCASLYKYSSGSFTMNVSFSTSGQPTVTLGGSGVAAFSPGPSSNDYSALKSAYSSQGAVLYSSIWTGWVPSVSGCSTSGGNLGSSSFSISNLKVYGSVVQGPAPTLCSGSNPTPAPTPSSSHPTPAPTPGPSSGGCNFQYNLNGRQCMGLSQKTGVTSASACQSACCSTSGCSVYQFWNSNSQCWIGNSGTTISASNCPANSGSFVSASTKAMSSAEQVLSDAQKGAIGGIVGGGVVLLILIVALVVILRSKARSRGKTMSDYVRESVVAEKPAAEVVPMEEQKSGSTLATETVGMQEPITEPADTTTAPKNPTWEQRTDPDNGKVFWFNSSTGVSQWETPDDITA